MSQCQVTATPSQTLVLSMHVLPRLTRHIDISAVDGRAAAQQTRIDMAQQPKSAAYVSYHAARSYLELGPAVPQSIVIH